MLWISHNPIQIQHKHHHINHFFDVHNFRLRTSLILFQQNMSTTLILSESDVPVSTITVVAS